MDTGAREHAIAVIGAGSIGIAVAYYLATRHGERRVVVIDPDVPMSLTSAQSGENYRNWWPHPVMTAFTDHSIDLLEEIADAAGDRIHMTRRGYALATRTDDPTGLIEDLHRGYGDAASGSIRVHAGAAHGYRPAGPGDWRAAPGGVDVLSGRGAIQAAFPRFAPDVSTVIHVRRAGDISGQQLGQVMLETLREAAGGCDGPRVTAIEREPAASGCRWRRATRQTRARRPRS